MLGVPRASHDPWAFGASLAFRHVAIVPIRNETEAPATREPACPRSADAHGWRLPRFAANARGAFLGPGSVPVFLTTPASDPDSLGVSAAVGTPWAPSVWTSRVLAAGAVSVSHARGASSGSGFHFLPPQNHWRWPPSSGAEKRRPPDISPSPRCYGNSPDSFPFVLRSEALVFAAVMETACVWVAMATAHGKLLLAPSPLPHPRASTRPVWRL